MRIGIDGDFSRRVGLEVWRSQLDQMQTSMARLASGLRINSAVDDAAGLAIAEGMRAQILGARQAQQNVQDGVNLLRVADSALSESMGLLQRMRVIAVQAGNGTYDARQRDAMQGLLVHAVHSLDSIAHETQYNAMRLLDGSRSAWSFQVGAGGDHALSVTIAGASAEHLGLAAGPPSPAPALAAPESPVASAVSAASLASAPVVSASEASVPVGTVSYSLTPTGGAKASLVTSWTGDPAAGTYWVQGGTVFAGRNASGAVVGSYDDRGLTVTFTAGGSVTVNDRLWKNARNESGGFTLTRTVTPAASASTALPAEPPSGPATAVTSSASGAAAPAAAISVRTVAEALEALARIDRAMALLTERRTGVGVAENTLLRQMEFLDVTHLNLTAAEGRLRDVDVAREASRLAKLQAAAEASALALSRANQAQFDAVALLLSGLPTGEPAAAAAPVGAPAAQSAAEVPAAGGLRRPDSAGPAVTGIDAADLREPRTR